jgi:Plasmid pRiA4b ORF-3-like protein
MLCVYQFRVVLRGISPMIWRRLPLRSDQSIADLHYTIQIAMGWSDSHLHRFHIHGKDYGVAHEGGLTFSDDPERVLLGQFGFRLRERFLYEYDFYDNWQHDIRLEKVLPLNSKRVFPVCIGGQPSIGSKLIAIVGRTELTGAPSINGWNNMLVVRGNGSFVKASGDEIPHPPRHRIRSWPTRAGDRLFGAQRASTGGSRSSSPRG